MTGAVVEDALFKRGVVIDRPKTLQDFFHHAAVEEKVALVGHDHRIGAGDA